MVSDDFFFSPRRAGERDLWICSQLVVNVHNNLPHSAFSVHWHGIAHAGVDGIFMDGASHVTQYDIAPGTNFTYHVQSRYSGVYWYHAHLDSLYIDGLYGAMLIRNKRADKFAVDGEFVALSSEHHSLPGQTLEVLARANSCVGGHVVPGFGCIFGLEAPEQLLINGRGPAFGDGQLAVFEVQRGKRYLLHVINAGFATAHDFAVAGHALTLVAVNGEYVKPTTVDTVSWKTLHVGVRLSFLLDANQPGQASVVCVCLSRLSRLSRLRHVRVLFARAGLCDSHAHLL